MGPGHPLYAAVDEALVQRLAETRGVALVKIAQPLRVALTGKTVSPPIDEVMEVLGKIEVIKRLHKAIEYIQQEMSKSKVQSSNKIQSPNDEM